MPAQRQRGMRVCRDAVCRRKCFWGENKGVFWRNKAGGVAQHPEEVYSPFPRRDDVPEVTGASAHMFPAPGLHASSTTLPAS